MTAHIYLSTSCLHFVHEHCRSAVNIDGDPKEPGTCKHCPARCICLCHVWDTTLGAVAKGSRMAVADAEDTESGVS